ncbi:MAG: MBL fold metallo-hydrolase [Anaerolineae bacterium]
MSVEAILLGTAQDGGLPQAGCDCARCRAAWQNPAHRRWVACLGLVDAEAKKSWLIDATPDFREQLHALYELAPGCPLSGLLLTHAHTGHYAGLIHLGREAWNTDHLPAYASTRMAGFLKAHAPWAQLVQRGNLDLHLLVPEEAVALSPRLRVTPVAVPHRDEQSDTLAFVVQGPRRRLFYCPDIDGWDRWDRDLRTFLSGIDIALLDGTFAGACELPGRDLGEIPHPLVTDTAERLAWPDGDVRPDIGMDVRSDIRIDGRSDIRTDVRLIHLNHSNPLNQPGPEREWLAARGIGVGARGARWRLD